MTAQYIKPGDPIKADPLLISYLDAIVALTCQREAQGLTASLIDSLCQHVQAGRFRLLGLTNSDGEAKVEDNQINSAVVRDWLDPLSTPVPIRLDKDLLTCVRTKIQVSRTLAGTSGRRLILPIISKDQVTAMLVIERLKEVGGEEDVLARLLHIFSNQLYLLSRNELDGLTGLYNRQAFDERMRRLVLEAARPERRAALAETQREKSLVLLDVDHFKLVNDRFGHLYGDEVLVQLSQIISRSFRYQDMLFRYGGEEFAVVLLGMNPELAVPVLESFRQTVESFEFPQIGRKTVSIGVASIAPGESVDTIINRADKAMYHAKLNGRNQVACYETLVAEGKLPPVTVATGDIELF